MSESCSEANGFNLLRELKHRLEVIDEDTPIVAVVAGFLLGMCPPNHVFTVDQLEKISREMVVVNTRYQEIVEKANEYLRRARVRFCPQLSENVGQNETMAAPEEVFTAEQSYFDEPERNFDEVPCEQPTQERYMENNRKLDFDNFTRHMENLNISRDHRSEDKTSAQQAKKSEVNNVNNADTIQRISFNDFVTKEKPYLSLVLERSPQEESVLQMVNSPLGVCYDEVLKKWIVADTGNNRVILYPESETVINEQIINKPSAVCVYKPGESFVVLVSGYIALHSHISRDISTLHRLRYSYRGLVITKNGYLATLRRKGTGCYLVLFDTLSAMREDVCKDEELASFRFSEETNCNPSFMHMVDDIVVITDLGIQQVTMCKLDTSDPRNIVFEIIAKHKRRWDLETEPNGSFNFVSGVQLDRNKYSIICDAAGRTMQLFDANLRFQYRMASDFELPYVSSFAVNNNGEVLICDRRGKLYAARLSSVEHQPDVDTLSPKRHLNGFGGGRGRGGFRGNGFNRGSTRGRGNFGFQ